MNVNIKNIKIIFLDIDGTLYNSEKNITKYTINVLNKLKEKDIYAVLCSGRTNVSVCNVSKEINASKYVIGNNGASVYDYVEDKEIFESTLDFNKIKYIWDYCEKNSIKLLLNSKNLRYCNEMYSNTNNIEKKKINNIYELNDKKIHQLVIESKKEQANEIHKLLNKQNELWAVNYGNTSKEDAYFFDVNNRDIDKGTGVKHLIEYLGVKKEETICFGDGVNDYAMFKQCGISVAMGNANEELKKLADYTTLTNNEDGVAKFIDRYILSK